MPSARLTRSGKHTPKCRRPPHNCRSAEDHEIKAPPFSLRDVWFETKMCSCWQILHINPGAKAAEFPLSSRVQVCAPGNKILIFAGTSFRFSYLRRYKFTASRPRSPPLLLIDSAAHQGCGIFRNQNSWNLCPPDLRSSQLECTISALGLFMQRSGGSGKVGCMCVQLEGVGVLGVGRVEHVLGSGILQIFYTPTWRVG